MFISVAMPSAASASASANTDSINTIYAFNLMFFAIALVAVCESGRHHRSVDLHLRYLVVGGFTLHFIGHVLFKAPNARCPVCNAFIAVVGCLHRARVMQPAAFSDEEKSIHAAHSAVLRSTYLALKTDVEERLGPSLGLSATVTNSASENVKNIAPETQYQSLPRDQDGDDVPSIVVASPSTDVLAPVSTHNLPDYDLLSADSTAYAPETMLDHLHALHNAAYLLANEAQEATDERPSCPIVDSLSCDDSFELSYLPSAFGAHEEYDDAAAQTSGSSTLSHGDSFEMNDASFEDVDLLEDGAHTLGGTWSAALPSSSSEDDILLLEQLAQIHRSGEDREDARPGCPIASTLSHDDSLAHLASSQDAVDDTEYAEFEADLTSSSTISLAEFAETHTVSRPALITVVLAFANTSFLIRTIPMGTPCNVKMRSGARRTRRRRHRNFPATTTRTPTTTGMPKPTRRS